MGPKYTFEVQSQYVENEKSFTLISISNYHFLTI